MRISGSSRWPLSVADVATREGVAVGTVKCWITRGRLTRTRPARRVRLRAELVRGAYYTHPAHLALFLVLTGRERRRG